MANFDFKSEEIMKLDLHNMDRWQAVKYLDISIALAPVTIKEIQIIHGYNSGKVLQQMVRKEYENMRVIRKILSLNLGITSYILNTWQSKLLTLNSTLGML